jgi:hypothetical protein
MKGEDNSSIYRWCIYRCNFLPRLKSLGFLPLIPKKIWLFDQKGVGNDDNKGKCAIWYRKKYHYCRHWDNCVDCFWPQLYGNKMK